MANDETKNNIEMISERIIVKGMSCASCSAAVEKAISTLEGVTDASVNLTTEKASFSYDPSMIKLSEIMDAVTNKGYS
ncbi:MAG: heavy metal-associated domain-containing protein, partial [Eubacteriales bacterium]|nr:heavy metal-associated domain-containing protein [Eubacteriales bacterium]